MANSVITNCLAWFTLLLNISLWPANVVLLLSCQSPSLNGIGLYYIDVHDLTTRLEAAAREFNPAYNSSLSGSERLLPTYWHFGISGICDIFDTTGEVYCRSAFCPDLNIISLVRHSLRDAIGRLPGPDNNTNSNSATRSMNEELFTNAVSSWRSCLGSIPDNHIPSKASNTFVIIFAVSTIIHIFTDICTLLKFRYALITSGLGTTASLTALIAFVVFSKNTRQTGARGGYFDADSIVLLVLVPGLVVRLVFALLGGALWSDLRKEKLAEAQMPPAEDNPKHPTETTAEPGGTTTRENSVEVVGTIDAPRTYYGP